MPYRAVRLMKLRSSQEPQIRRQLTSCYYVLSNLLFDGAKVRLFFELRIFWFDDGQIPLICFHVSSLSGRGT